MILPLGLATGYTAVLPSFTWPPWEAYQLVIVLGDLLKFKNAERKVGIPERASLFFFATTFLDREGSHTHFRLFLLWGRQLRHSYHLSEVPGKASQNPVRIRIREE